MTTEQQVKVIETHDNEIVANIRAEVLWSNAHKTAVMTTIEWNRYHPDQQVRTANRFVVYGVTQEDDQ